AETIDGDTPKSLRAASASGYASNEGEQTASSQRRGGRSTWAVRERSCLVSRRVVHRRRASPAADSRSGYRRSAAGGVDTLAEGAGPPCHLAASGLSAPSSASLFSVTP